MANEARRTKAGKKVPMIAVRLREADQMIQHLQKISESAKKVSKKNVAIKMTSIAKF